VWEEPEPKASRRTEEGGKAFELLARTVRSGTSTVPHPHFDSPVAKPGTNKIGIDYFMKAMEEKQKDPRDSADEILECFQMFDKDGNGFLTVSEFKHILTNLGDKFTEEEWAEVEKDIDDGSGMISYEEFTKMALSGC